MISTFRMELNPGICFMYSNNWLFREQFWSESHWSKTGVLRVAKIMKIISNLDVTAVQIIRCCWRWWKKLFTHQKTCWRCDWFESQQFFKLLKAWLCAYCDLKYCDFSTAWHVIMLSFDNVLARIVNTIVSDS